MCAPCPSQHHKSRPAEEAPRSRGGTQRERSGLDRLSLPWERCRGPPRQRGLPHLLPFLPRLVLAQGKLKHGVHGDHGEEASRRDAEPAEKEQFRSVPLDVRSSGQPVRCACDPQRRIGCPKRHPPALREVGPLALQLNAVLGLLFHKAFVGVYCVSQIPVRLFGALPQLFPIQGAFAWAQQAAGVNEIHEV